MIQKVLLASPRGFCAGVARAVRTVEECLEIFGAPIYVKHEIVHNKAVVHRLEALGAITVNSSADIPENAVVVFSAHGSPPEDYEIARQKHATVIDATCPLVNKVHLEMHRFLKDGYSVVYIGHKGHPEGRGVIGEAAHHYRKNIPLVESEEDAKKLSFPRGEKLAFLTQTTLSIAETEKIIQALKKKYPNILAPPGKDICYATTNRQKAVTELARAVDLVLIVGSANSSNSTRLVETAQAEGVPAHLIDGPEYIDSQWLENITRVGISAGASAPESQVDAAIDFFRKEGASVETLLVTEESTRFPEPRELAPLRKTKSHE